MLKNAKKRLKDVGLAVNACKRDIDEASQLPAEDAEGQARLREAKMKYKELYNEYQSVRN